MPRQKANQNNNESQNEELESAVNEALDSAAEATANAAKEAIKAQTAEPKFIPCVINHNFYGGKINGEHKTHWAGASELVALEYYKQNCILDARNKPVKEGDSNAKCVRTG